MNCSKLYNNKFEIQMYVSEAAKSDMPKKPQNGYMRYRADVYEDVRKANQEKSMTELTQVISSMWAGLDEKKKDV